MRQQVEPETRLKESKPCPPMSDRPSVRILRSTPHLDGSPRDTWCLAVSNVPPEWTGRNPCNADGFQTPTKPPPKVNAGLHTRRGGRGELFPDNIRTGRSRIGGRANKPMQPYIDNLDHGRQPRDTGHRYLGGFANGVVREYERGRDSDEVHQRYARQRIKHTWVPISSPVFPRRKRAHDQSGSVLRCALIPLWLQPGRVSKGTVVPSISPRRPPHCRN